MNANPWVERLAPRSHPRLRLFCFPYAGGGAAVFRQWPAFLPDTVEVCPVEIPGRGRRFGEPLFKSVDPLVLEAAENIEPLLDRPFAFFGHSMGGLLAFELARSLRRKGVKRPQLLFVSASEPPHNLRVREKILHQLPDDELLKELERLGGTPPEVLKHRELVQLFLPVVRADMELLETYRYVNEDPLTIPLIAFAGEGDREVTVQEMEAWRSQTSQKFSLHSIPGDHFFLKTAQEEVLAKVAQELVGVIPT